MSVKNIRFAILTCVCVLIAVCLVRPARAATSDEIRNQIDQLEEEEAALSQEMDALESKIKQNTTELGDLVATKAALDQQVSVLNSQIRNIQDQLHAYNAMIADKQEELDDAQAQLDKLQQQSRTRIRAMEENGDISYWSVLFQADSFSDFLERLVIVQEIQDGDKRCLQEMSSAAEQVAKVKQSLDNEKAVLVSVQEKLEASERQLNEKHLLADAALQQLLDRGEEYNQLLEESENRQQQLMEQIANKENEYDKIAREEWLATSVPETTGSHSSSKPNGVTWITPVPYYTLTSPFGMRIHPILGVERLHNGVDLALAAGQPIYATRDGVVDWTAYEEDGAGYYVQINHGDGYKSIYMHMTNYIVYMGQKVKAGQIIGYVGSTGLSSGPHLHFGISYKGTYVNPMEYIS